MQPTPYIDDTQLSTRLDGSYDVPLAPIKGVDLRRNLPRSLFIKNPTIFLAKFFLALAVISLGYVAIIVDIKWYVSMLAILIIGLMYAHLVELQHETLHEHAFNSRLLNRIFGIACGLFMFSSYSHYKYDHLRHHASLGQPDNREFFNYRFYALSSPIGLLRASWHLGRYVDVSRNIFCSITGKAIVDHKHMRDNRRISTEYRSLLLIAVGATAFTFVTGNLLLIFAWLLPTLVIAEPVHFLIELPEHFGLNTQDNPNVLDNTRSIKTSPLVRWFTNSNNLHTAHHYHQGIPIVNIGILDKMVSDQYRTTESSYRQFYRKVLKGDIKYTDLTDTCMTR